MRHFHPKIKSYLHISWSQDYSNFFSLKRVIYTGDYSEKRAQRATPIQYTAQGIEKRAHLVLAGALPESSCSGPFWSIDLCLPPLSLFLFKTADRPSAIRACLLSSSPPIRASDSSIPPSSAPPIPIPISRPVVASKLMGCGCACSAVMHLLVHACAGLLG